MIPPSIIPSENIRKIILIHLIRSFWLLFVVGNFVLLVTAVPAYYTQLHTICYTSVNFDCNFAQLTEDRLAILHNLGVSFSAYVNYTVILHTTTSVLYFSLGVLLFRSRFRGWYIRFSSHFSGCSW